MARTRWAVLLLTIAAIVAVSCSNQEQAPADTTGPTSATGVSGTAGPTATETVSSPGSPTLSPSPTSEPAAELEDGRHFGFIHSVESDGSSLVFDLAYFFTGDEANEAAEEHGDETPVPNDYYIVNDNPKLRTLSLSSDPRVILLDWDVCCDRTFVADVRTFAEAIDADARGLVTIDGRLYYGQASPYWLRLEDGAVTTIEEQYLP